MPRFFLKSIADSPVITGADGVHISRALRMKPGERLVVCDKAGYDYDCVIKSISGGDVFLDIVKKHPNVTEPSVCLKLFVCLPKGDGMDDIIRHAVELGVSEIYPVVSSRCVSRPDARSASSKLARWQKISDEAAGQSGRGRIPPVNGIIPLDRALTELAGCDLSVVFYEGGGEPLRGFDYGNVRSIGVLTGPEGGFSESEIEACRAAGARIATLGPRILRAVTAPLAAVTAVMLLAGQLE